MIDGLIAHFTESRFDLYKDLMLYRSRDTLEARLVALGIDVTVSSLAKDEDQLAELYQLVERHLRIRQSMLH